MKSRLHHISITNFKAFRDFQLPLEGRHLLVYGGNGAGKSSLYWALYTFLQSARKPADGISKYFDPAHDEKLLNIHEQKEDAPRPGEISLTLRSVENQTDTTYRISQSVHGTHDNPVILKSDLASDFITYRFFFGFSHFRNSERFNLWPLFEKEILPFCVSTSGQSPYAMWQKIRAGAPNPSGARGRGGKYAYTQFATDTQAFAAVLPQIVDDISTEAQKFYARHFAANDPTPLKLKLAVTTAPSFTGTQQSDSQFVPPEISFGILVGGQEIKRPQSYLNEAKLTQLALSVRFAASLVNLNDADLKLLVLDDLLVSLDMSNRMKVVDIVLSETFHRYQKIILTHDMGFFREFQRRIGQDHAAWRFVSLNGKASENIIANSEKTDLQKAEDYLNGYDLEAAANALRKAAENTAKRYRAWAEGKEPEPGEFFSLTQDLQAARNKMLDGLPSTLYLQVLKGLNEVTEPHRALILSANDDDLDNNTGLTPKDLGILKSKRRNLRHVLSHDGWAKMKTLETVDSVLAMTARVLNPASHSHTTPLYEVEVREAMEKVRQLIDALGTEMSGSE